MITVIECIGRNVATRKEGNTERVGEVRLKAFTSNHSLRHQRCQIQYPEGDGSFEVSDAVRVGSSCQNVQTDLRRRGKREAKREEKAKKKDQALAQPAFAMDAGARKA
jgi:hypothetical protein